MAGKDGSQKSVVKKREIAGHAAAGIGQNLVYGLWGSYILIFYTDVFGITAGAAGLIMMFTRIWDAVNDPMMGMVADRTRTKWGRYRPWLLFMAVPVGILLILNFYTPDLSGGGKVAYAAITYVLLSMAFTAVDIPYWSLPSAMTRDSSRRAGIFSIARTATTLTSVISAVIIIPLTQRLGGGSQEKGFFRTAVLFAAFSIFFYMIGFGNIREHVEPVKQKKEGLGNSLKVLACNKPLLLIILSVLIILTANGLRNSTLPYFAQYNLGALSLVSILTALSIPGMLAGMLLAPVLAKKFGKKKVFLGACIYGMISNLLFFFTEYTDTVRVFLMIALTGVSFGFILVLESAMIADTIEYAQWKTGQRREGMISSTQTFVSKLCLALSGGLIGLILTVTGYTPGQVQTGTTLMAFHMMMTLVVAAAFALAMVPMFFYGLTEEVHAGIVKELEAESRNEEAEE